jgi:hypothetical protein
MFDNVYLQLQSQRLRWNVIRALKSDRDLRRVRYLGKGERLLRYEAEGLKAVWVARGGYIESSTITTSIIESPQDVVGVHISEQQEKLFDKQTWRTITELATTRLTDEIVRRMSALEAAGQMAQHPDRQLIFGVWPKDVATKAYLEPDNWYFHVLLRVPAGGMVL